VNTRGINFRGGLNKSIFRPQFLKVKVDLRDTTTGYAESIKPAGGNPIILELNCKDFKTGCYDFPLAEANLTLPSKFIDLQLGYGRNFIGDGYRSCSKVMVQVRILILN
jgi:hypothetical protein